MHALLPNALRCVALQLLALVVISLPVTAQSVPSAEAAHLQDADTIRAALGGAWINLAIELHGEEVVRYAQTRRGRASVDLPLDILEALALPPERLRAWRWTEALLAHGPLSSALRALQTHAPFEAAGWATTEDDRIVFGVRGDPLLLEFDGQTRELRRISAREEGSTWVGTLHYDAELGAGWIPSRIDVRMDGAPILSVRVLDAAIDRHALAPLPREEAPTPDPERLPFRRLPL